MAALKARLFELFAQPIDVPADDAFNALALDIFAFQCERNAAYGAFCRRRGRVPGRVEHWSQIPAVPAAAFREVELAAGDASAAQAVFRTSGTTRGERRGTHFIIDLSIYHGALLSIFRAMVLPDATRPVMLSLIPPAHEMPESSLAHMVDVVVRRFGGPGSGFFASAGGGLDGAGLDRALRLCEERGEAACLLGTSFSFVHWTDELPARRCSYRLPAGSRLMDTGGFKGRSREVAQTVLHAVYLDLLGIPPAYCVNEYGMTELCSQFYDTTLRDAVRQVTAERRKLVPPWVRTMVVDAETLEPLSPGSTGLLRHIDLANLGSALAVQTEDTGVEVAGGFRVLGRVAGAQPRGCSIAMDDLLRAVESRPV